MVLLPCVDLSMREVDRCEAKLYNIGLVIGLRPQIASERCAANEEAVDEHKQCSTYEPQRPPAPPAGEPQIRACGGMVVTIQDAALVVI